MKVFRATMPWPPSWNHLHGRKRNYVYLRPEGRLYYDNMRLLLLAAREDWRKTGDPVELTLHFHPPNLRRRDSDNVVKTIQDAITKSGVVWVDDCQVKHRHVYVMREPDRPHGRVEIAVRVLEKGEWA